MPRDDDQSPGDEQTYEEGAQPAESSDRSPGDQSSLSDVGGLTGDADLNMEIVDLSRYEVQETLGQGSMGDALRGYVASVAPESATPGAVSPIPEVTGEPVAGKCPKCHAQNESSRKFCRGCGESLRISCVSCNAEVPVWENFCGACGGNPKELIAAKIAEEKRVREANRIASGYRRAAVMRTPLITNSIGMPFASCPSGTFEMGEGQHSHTVTLTKAFDLGVYEVTQEQYEAVMGRNPSFFKGPLKPVEQVSWDDAVEFCRKLSALQAEKKAGYVYRLPTEAEWEYACRAGTTSEYSFGDSDSELGAYAWFGDNSGDQQIDALNIWNTDKDNYGRRLFDHNCRTHPVSQKKPNPWGLYDMHGNVWEWCQDWDGDHPSGSVTDPTGPASGDRRLLRGGSFTDHSSLVRSALRFYSARPVNRIFNIGFRLARTQRLVP